MPNTLSCPVPATLDPLTANGFQLTIAKLPGVSFFCQEANIPSVGLQALGTNTPLVKMNQPSNQLQYGPLVVSFMVDAKMDNYAAMLGWMEGLGFPLTYQQYTDFRSAQSGLPGGGSDFSAGTLIVLDQNNHEIRRVDFADLIPTSINTITFSTKLTDVKYVICQATFTYDYFTLV